MQILATLISLLLPGLFFGAMFIPLPRGPISKRTLYIFNGSAVILAFLIIFGLAPFMEYLKTLVFASPGDTILPIDANPWLGIGMLLSMVL